MEKKRLGQTNLMVTKVGFGGIPIQRLNDCEAVTLILHILVGIAINSLFPL